MISSASTRFAKSGPGSKTNCRCPPTSCRIGLPVMSPGQQIRRELDALRLQPQRLREPFHELRLAEPRQALRAADAPARAARSARDRSAPPGQRAPPAGRNASCWSLAPASAISGSVACSVMARWGDEERQIGNGCELIAACPKTSRFVLPTPARLPYSVSNSSTFSRSRAAVRRLPKPPLRIPALRKGQALRQKLVSRRRLFLLPLPLQRLALDEVASAHVIQRIVRVHLLLVRRIGRRA